MTHPAPATLHVYADPAFQMPAPEDVRAVIQLLGLTGDQVAGLVGVRDGRAVRRWVAPQGSKTHAQIDYAAWRLLLLEAGLVQLRKRRVKKERRLSGPNAIRSKRSGMDTASAVKDAGLAVPRLVSPRSPLLDELGHIAVGKD